MMHRHLHAPPEDRSLGHFRSKGFSHGHVVPGSGRPATAMGRLPPILRALLVGDGTVTKTLEAYFWEPVGIAAVQQRVVRARMPIVSLGMPAGEPVLSRHVELRGQHSGRHFANACSLIRLEAVPPAVRTRLLEGSIGIGDLIRSCGLESYRELLELAMTDDFSLAEPAAHPRQACVRRTYRISIGGRPSLQVTECFPLRTFSLAPHEAEASAERV